MAQVRQQGEEYQSAQVACYAEYGFTAVPEMAGGAVAFVGLPQDPAAQDLLDQAWTDCNARIPKPAFLQNQVLDDAAYQKMLDLRQCIVDHGYRIPDAPSLETWKESAVSDAWNPFQFFVGSGDVFSLSQDKLHALADQCPQPGPNFFVDGPAGS